MEQKAFGRRAPQPAFSGIIKTPAGSGGLFSERAEPPEQARIAFESAEDRAVDDELREWKKARRKNIRLPWRQISFVASICFGVGSLVLPASVNALVEWPLMGLAAASLIAGFSMRGKPRGQNMPARAAKGQEP